MNRPGTLVSDAHSTIHHVPPSCYIGAANNTIPKCKCRCGRHLFTTATQRTKYYPGHEPRCVKCGLPAEKRLKGELCEQCHKLERATV